MGLKVVVQNFQALSQVKSGLSLWTNNSQILHFPGSYVLAEVTFFVSKSLFSNRPCLGHDHGK